jgi:hypothetical protein
MANITKAERERRAAEAAGNPNPDATAVEGDTGAPALEPFQEPVPVVKAESPTPNGLVKVRVLPNGDGRVATGHYDRETNAFSYHKKGDHLCVPEHVAKAQEKNGLVEIVDGN